MKHEKLINWSELRRRFGGNIRPDTIPKKHRRKINKLFSLLDKWEEWVKKEE